MEDFVAPLAGEPHSLEGGDASPQWKNLLDFLPEAANPPPTSRRPEGGVKIPLEERLLLACEWLLPRLLAGESSSPKDVQSGVDRFREAYRTANAVGTLLGRGVRGQGLDLHFRDGQIQPCYENARKVVDCLGRLSSDRLAAAASACGLEDAAAVVAAIQRLPKL